jgi:shikimate 5-dehydrogenase
MTGTGQATVTGATRLYAIIGDPIEQVRSPEVLNPRFAAAGLNAVLVPVHVRPERFDQTVRDLMAPGDGIPMALDGLTADVLAIDVIHKPETTPFLDAAHALGCRTFNGYLMLHGQAEELAGFLISAAPR